MKLIETGSFPIAEIDVGKRLRTVDEDWAQGLAAMFASTGMQNPVQIMQVGNEYRLIAGAHRLRAHVIMGASDIQAKVYAPETDDAETEIEIQQIIENIARRELNPLDRAAHIAALKLSYLKLYGETRGAQSHAKNRTKSISAKIALFDLGDDVASKMGLSKRTIFADVKLHEGLNAMTRARVSGTALAGNRQQLRELAALDAVMQGKTLDLLLAAEPVAKKVSDALAILSGRPKDKKLTPAWYYMRIVKAWADAPKAARRDFLAYLSERKELPGQAS